MAVIAINRPGWQILGQPQDPDPVKASCRHETKQKSSDHAGYRPHAGMKRPSADGLPEGRQGERAASQSNTIRANAARLYASLAGRSKQSLPAVVTWRRLITQDTASLETAGRLALSLGSSAKTAAPSHVSGRAE